MTRRRRSSVAAVALVAATLGTPATARSEVCSDIRIPVMLAEEEISVGGTLCLPRGWHHAPLLILLSGATYGQPYWDFPLQPTRYSFVQAATAERIATLNLDRPGIGESDHPAPQKLTLSAESHVLHQVVEAVRNGDGGQPRPRQVVLVGHSFGAYVAQHEAATHGDVDGLIITGALRAPPVGAPALLANLMPAQLEARLVDRPVGYVTTRPESRGNLFYHSGDNADPNVITADEATKETASATEIATISDGTAPEIAAAIDVPVLLVAGEYDNVWCPTSCASSGAIVEERKHFTNARSFTTYVLPDAGHVVNLHRNAGDWFEVATTWVHDFAKRRLAE